MPIFADAREEAFVFLSVSSNILKIDKMTHADCYFRTNRFKSQRQVFWDGVDQVFTTNRYRQGHCDITTIGVHWHADATRCQGMLYFDYSLQSRILMFVRVHIEHFIHYSSRLEFLRKQSKNGLRKLKMVHT